MRHVRNVFNILAVIASVVVVPEVEALENVSKYNCQAIGSGISESLGDGLLISTDEYTCRIDSGPLGGGVLTGRSIWKWSGPDAVLVSGDGVARKDGAAWIFVQTEGKIAVTTAGGKVTGFGASGKGRIAAASGAAASETGKTTTWTVEPTGVRQFTVTEDRIGR
jgi:hypothetical protein